MTPTCPHILHAGEVLYWRTGEVFRGPCVVVFIALPDGEVACEEMF